MFCGLGKKNKPSKNGLPPAPMPHPRGIVANQASQGVDGAGTPDSTSTLHTPIDLRAEKDEPLLNNTKLIDYLQTEVATKTDETRWVLRLFSLSPDAISCFYESAPHLQDEGKNVLAKIVIPIGR